MYTERHVFQASGKIQIPGRVINRVRAQNKQNLHPPGFHITDQVPKLRSLIDGTSFDRSSVEDRLSDIAQGEIAGVGQGMDKGRLAFSRENDGRSWFVLQVSGDGANPAA